MGVQEMTRYGMKENDFEILAGYIADVIINNAGVKETVATFRKKFLQMQYCLPVDEAAPLVARIFSSIFPNEKFLKLIAERINPAT